MQQGQPLRVQRMCNKGNEFKASPEADGVEVVICLSDDLQIGHFLVSVGYFVEADDAARHLLRHVVVPARYFPP